MGINASYGEGTKLKNFQNKVCLPSLLCYLLCSPVGTLVVISLLFRSGILSTRKILKAGGSGIQRSSLETR